jgi:arylsulfatase A-like enzyme
MPMPERKPNILLVVLDTLRRDRLSAYGHTRPTSPAFDDFAQKGALFERAVSPAQWTIPAHASLFTGLYPSAHGLTQASGHLSGMHPTLAEILQAGGYHTAAFCNNGLLGVIDHGLQRGFDDFFLYAGAAVARPDDGRRGQMGRAFDRRFRPFARRVSNIFAQNDTLFRISMRPLLVPIWTRGINFKGHTAHSIDDLIAYWGARRAGGQAEPLFAFLNLMGAHLPYKPTAAALDKVAPGLRRERAANAFMQRFNKDAAAWASPDDPPLEDWQRAALHDYYDAEIVEQDAHLARLFRWLHTSGTLKDTLVIVTADHGESHGDHALFGHGFVVHQELVHVPLLLAGEAFPPGLQVDTTVSTRRIFHTVLEAAGLRTPVDAADPNADIAGLSLVNALPNAHGAEHDTAFSEAVPPQTFLRVIEHRNPASIQRLGLRLTRRGLYRGARKLTVAGDTVEALYDTATDPTENANIAHRAPDEVAALHGAMQSFIAAHQPHTAATPEAAFSPEVEDHLRALGYID